MCSVAPWGTLQIQIQLAPPPTLETKEQTNKTLRHIWIAPFDYKNMPPIFRYSVSAATGYVAEVVYEGTPVFPAVSQKLVRPKYEN